MNRLLAGAAAAALLIVTVACGGGGGQPNSSGGQTSQAPTQAAGPASGIGECMHEAADGPQVKMVDPHDFDPKDITISVGETVTWVNESKNNHTVTFDNSDVDCGYVLIGQSASITFSEPGSYRYVDRIYGNSMSGTVTVQ